MSLERSAGDHRANIQEIVINNQQIFIKRATSGNLPKSITLGPKATFSEFAANQLLGEQVEHHLADSNPGFIGLVKKREADIGVVASENSRGGIVGKILKTLIYSDLTILGELSLPVHQNLYGTRSALEKGIVNSHPQALDQTRIWIDENIPGNVKVAQKSTSEGVRIAKEKDELGIGSMMAGMKYDIPLIAENIHDDKSNTTRFWVVGRGKTEPTGNDRTIIVNTLPNKPGSFIRILQEFADRGINLNRVENIPMTLDHYYFLYTVDGHKDDQLLADALVEADRNSWRLKTIGSFQKHLLDKVIYEQEAIDGGWVPEEENGNSH